MLKIMNYTKLNSSNFSIFEYDYCETHQTFSSIEKFLKCYGYFFNRSSSSSILEILLFIGAFTINFLVIILLYARPIKISIFDQILIGYCFVNGLTGIVDIPFYHVSSIFGYWPFGEISSKLWVIIELDKKPNYRIYFIKLILFFFSLFFFIFCRCYISTIKFAHQRLLTIITSILLPVYTCFISLGLG
jgi:hypothetical protein